jgi:ribonuclease P protein component
LEKKKINQFRNAQKIKRQLEIKKVLTSGKRWICSWCSIYSLENGMKRNRCAIVVPKTTGSAVERNKIKRVVREQFRYFLKSTPLHIDILVKIHPEKDAKEIKCGLEKALSLWLIKERK